MEDMKKVCLLAFVLFTWSIVVNAQESDGRYVEVTGSSEIEVVPDEIHFLVQIKEYWQEEYTGKSKKEEDFHTKVPLAMIEICRYDSFQSDTNGHKTSTDRKSAVSIL